MNRNRREPATVYRVRQTMIAILGFWVLGLAIVVIVASGSRARLEPWQEIGLVIAYAAVTIPGIRMGIASVRCRDSGVTVVNPLRTYRLKWREIDHVEMRRYRLFFEFCLIYRVDGGVIAATAIGASPGRPARRGSVEGRQAFEEFEATLLDARPRGLQEPS
jgi:hypothetical protein